MKKKAVVAMSGGVDSSVAAALLQKEGYEVLGVTLNLFSPEKGKPACCGAAEAAAGARAVCDTLGVRHYTKNAEEIFGRKVIDAFVESYLAGHTPNPCVECNRFLKFSYLFDIALALGADRLATGHYARIEEGADGWRLLRGRDPLKDQSYFLYCLEKERLSSILFPLGGMEKSEVRKIAAGLALPSSGKKESNDICFVEGGYSGYLRKKGVRPRPGNIVGLDGTVLGRHEGFFNYTIGQRRGLGIYGPERLYVAELRPAANEVVLGGLEDATFGRFTAAGMNWLCERPQAGTYISAQIRYRHKPAVCLVDSCEGEGFSGTFEEPQFAPARGQSVVFYHGERVLGGGVIETTGR